MMANLKVNFDTLLEQVIPMAAGHTRAWQEGYRTMVAFYNATAAEALSDAYDLPHELVANNSQPARISRAMAYQLEDKQKFEGCLSAWLQLHREDYLQVVAGQIPGMQADPELRSAMLKFFRDGKLD